MAPAFVTGAVLPRSGLCAGTTAVSTEPARFEVASTTYAPLEIYAAKHAQLKAAKKSNRLRPRKHRPSDIHRAPISHHPEPHLVDGPSPFYAVLDEEEVTALEARLAAAEPGTVLTVDHVKALESEIAEKEAKEAAETAEKRRVARVQSKADSATSRQKKMAAHQARKLVFEEAVQRRNAASAASAADAAAILETAEEAVAEVQEVDDDEDITVEASAVPTDDPKA
jgi:hypothetical protein